MKTPTTTTASQGWFDTIKSKIEGFIGQFDLSWQQLTQLGIALAIGITLGFLVKRFGRQALFFIIIFAGVLFGLEYFNIITIQWTNLKDLFGFAPADTVEGFLRTYFDWAQQNILAVITGLIGFIIGYKIS